MSRPAAVATIYLLALGTGLGSVALPHASLLVSVILVLQALAVIAVVLILLFYERRALARDEAA